MFSINNMFSKIRICILEKFNFQVSAIFLTMNDFFAQNLGNKTYFKINTYTKEHHLLEG